MPLQTGSGATTWSSAHLAPPHTLGGGVQHDVRLTWPFGSGDGPHAPTLSGRTVLLAFDQSVEAAAATRLAKALANQLDAAVEVVSVVDTTPVPIPYPLDLAIAMSDPVAGSAFRRAQEREIRGQVSALLDAPIDWPTAIELGVPALAIARQAVRTSAALIIMGLRRHGRMDRVVHDETALSVMRKAVNPVLGVAAGATGLPTSSLVAMDFSRASVHAAATAAMLMAGGGRMTLAYVETLMEHELNSSEGVIHSLGLDAAFAKLEAALARKGLMVDHVVLHRASPGMPSATLLEFAAGLNIDLLAAGSARHGRLDRILLGSVSAELVRDGRYSVLIVPP